MISMSRNGRSDASSSLLLAIAVAFMVGAGLLAFAMSASGFESQTSAVKIITVHTWRDSTGTEMVRVNETEKVVIITETGIAAGWTVATPVPSPTISNNGTFYIP